MSDTTWTVRIIRSLLDILNIGFIYQIKFNKKAKKMAKLLPILHKFTSQADKWSSMKTQQKVEKESKR